MKHLQEEPLAAAQDGCRTPQPALLCEGVAMHGRSWAGGTAVGQSTEGPSHWLPSSREKRTPKNEDRAVLFQLGVSDNIF